MHKFLIVFEKTETGYSAFCPDLPGCVATGKDLKDVENNIYEAIEMHIEGLIEDNLPIPESKSFSEYVVFKDDTPEAA